MVEGLCLLLWETQWSTGERELVLANQEVPSVTPVMLAKLMSRRRALLESTPSFDYVSARRVDPDTEDWPRFSSCSRVDLNQLVPSSALESLTSGGLLGFESRQAALGSSGPNRGQLIAMFEPGAHWAAMGFHVMTRVRLTLVKCALLDR